MITKRTIIKRLLKSDTICPKTKKELESPNLCPAVNDESNQQVSQSMKIARPCMPIIDGVAASQSQLRWISPATVGDSGSAIALAR